MRVAISFVVCGGFLKGISRELLQMKNLKVIVLQFWHVTSFAFMLCCTTIVIVVIFNFFMVYFLFKVYFCNKPTIFYLFVVIGVVFVMYLLLWCIGAVEWQWMLCITICYAC